MSESLSPPEQNSPEESPAPEFVSVAAVNDIAEGKAKTVKVDGKEVAVFHIGEEFFAISNICPHYGAQLCEGFVRNATVMCPWHGWQFDLKTGQGVNYPSQSVKTYAVKVEAGEIKIAAL